MPDFVIEKGFIKKGYKYVCGVDEAGRGPLAGPVCAAAVILPQDIFIEGLNDSKKLTEKKREELFPIIKEKAIAWSVSFASVEEIEEFNILNATYIAMNRAINGLDIKPDFALIDGNRVPKNITVDCQTVVKGDALSCSIAAASIIAKVTRDKLMNEYDNKYPQYGFSKHKGYGTALHYKAVDEFGLCPIHRPSFFKKYFEGK
jgi:ribonuclease HII